MIPIFVPLYKSYHILEKFIISLEKETKSEFIVYFLDNEPEIVISDSKNTARLSLELESICEKYGYRKDKYVGLISFKNLMYTGSVNLLHYMAELDGIMLNNNFFVILNPDCYAMNDNWLTQLKECWESIRNFDKSVSTLGCLQYYDETKFGLWHGGCRWKDSEEKCHERDWAHLNQIPIDRIKYLGNGSYFWKVDGNTGSAIAIDNRKFIELGFNEKDFPHYSSDYDFCERSEKKGYSHYCCSVEFIHQAGTSSLK